MHGKAREQTEIAEEKEIIETSTIKTLLKNKYGNIIQSELKEQLENNIGNTEIEIIDNGNSLVVKFIRSERYYEIDSDGNVSGPIKLIKDKYAGDFTKGGILDGSENKPYQINCIEDLVTFSIATNRGNTELGIIANQFQDQYVILMRTLDFKSIFSYNDYTTKKYGDLNENGIIEDIKTELTNTNSDCIGFTPIAEDFYFSFRGTFDGQNNNIKNIYEKNTSNLGFFGSIQNATIRNLKLDGIISCNETSGNTGGLVGSVRNRKDNKLYSRY